MLKPAHAFFWLLTLVSAAVAAQPDYFPLQVGNQWVYRSSRGDDLSLQVVESKALGDKLYYLLRGNPGGDAWLRMADDGTLYSVNPAGGPETVWAAFGSADGQSYSTSIEPCTAAATLRSHAAKIDVPLGHFETTVAIDYAPKCADAGLTGEWYLAYVGLMRRVQTSIAGPVAYDLVYARTGNTTTFAAPEVSFTAALDKSVYPAGAVSQAFARLTLRNTTPDPVSLTFPSGQRYDVVVRNDRGDIVYQWSRGKFFTMIFGTQQVTGESTWAAPFPVADQGGQPLPPGRYTVEAWLATDPPAWRAQIAIQVK